MKILIIYLEDEKAKAKAVRSLFDKKDFTFKSLILAIPEEAAENFNLINAPCSVQLISKLEELKHEYIPPHVLILSKLPKRYIDFMAGYSCVSNQPFTVFGDSAIAGIPNQYSNYFVTINTEDELLKF